MCGAIPGYNFRTFAEQDVEQINALYVQEYGERYPYPVKHGSAGLTLCSSVAMTEGSVIGFARAMPYAGNDRIYEFGGLIVEASHRLQGVARCLTQRRLNAVHEIGASMIFSEPVCNRPDKASQFNLKERGFGHYGILPFKYPEIKTQILGHQPESVAMAVDFLKTAAGERISRIPLESRSVFVPAEYTPFVHSILPNTRLGTSKAQAMHYPMPKTVMHHSFCAATQVGSHFVDIPANWLESTACIEYYRQQGFLFAGVLPSFGLTEDGLPFDYITLYRPSRSDFNFNLVHVLPELEPLKKLMANEYSRLMDQPVSSQRGQNLSLRNAV